MSPPPNGLPPAAFLSRSGSSSELEKPKGVLLIPQRYKGSVARVMRAVTLMANRDGDSSTLDQVNRRIVTLLAALAPILVLGIVGSVVTVPYVALGPGPTFNTLGTVEVNVDGNVVTKPVVDIDGTEVDPTTGNLNMTTVSVRDG